MDLVKRKTTYRIYPSAKQSHQMVEMLRLHQRLYNAALEQRIDAYKRCAVSLNFYDQCKELTQLRASCPEYAALNAQSEQITLKRLHKAFDAFFRRLEAGSDRPGFPRFKSFDRFKGWGYATHGDGWKFHPGGNFVNGTLRISGVGHLQARGRSRHVDEEQSSRNPGAPKTLEILRKNDKWYASVTFETPRPHRGSGEAAFGLDWGVSKFLTVVDLDAKTTVIENPRHLKKWQITLAKAQRSLTRKKKGSSNRRKAKRRLRDRYARLTWAREDFLHQTSARLIKCARFLATESLNIKNMTAHGGAHKAGLNRSILDTSPGKFLELLAYKAADAGIPYVEVPTRKIKPTQTCSGCGRAAKKELKDRSHDCMRCGLKVDRDVNAALVILNYALTGKVTGWEPALGVESEDAHSLKHETPPRPKQVRRTSEAWVE